MPKKIDVQNLDYTLALLIKPLLERYQEETTNFPSVLYHFDDPMAEWQSRLSQMNRAFDYLIELKGQRPCTHDSIYTIASGLRLFSMHYLDLWF